MEEWLSYRLGDFLMFSERTYWRLFELQNAALWPLPFFAPATLALASIGTLWRPAVGLRVLAATLALAWAWVGWSFVWQRYAPINWAMDYVAPAFGIQALLLAFAAVSEAGWTPTLRTRGVVGFVLLAWGVLLHPLIAPLFGRPLAQVEIAGVAPDPTAVATLGFGLLMPSRRMRLAIMAIPVLWLGLSTLILWLLEARESLLTLAALLLAAAGLVARRRR